MIKKYDAYYDSTDGKSNIHVNIWRDESVSPVGMIQIIHGVAEHIGRYEKFAEYFVKNGFVVFGNDQIGHGKSVEMMTQLGDFGEEDDDIRLVDDVNLLNRIMRKKYPEIPCYVLGIDMGSLVARIFASDFPHKVNGLILCSVLYGDEPISIFEPFLSPIGSVLGKDNLVNAPFKTFGLISSRFLKENDDNAYISRSVQNRDEYDSDPLCGFPITYGSLTTIAKLMSKCSSRFFYQSFPLNIPVLIIGGANDPVGFFGRDAVNLANKLENRHIKVEVRQYPGLRHDILNEDDPEFIYEDISKWIKASSKKENAGI